MHILVYFDAKFNFLDTAFLVSFYLTDPSISLFCFLLISLVFKLLDNIKAMERVSCGSAHTYLQPSLLS